MKKHFLFIAKCPKSVLLFCLSFVLFFAQCGNDTGGTFAGNDTGSTFDGNDTGGTFDGNEDDVDGYGKDFPRTGEATAIIDSCMSFMHSDAAKSHHIIDSVCQAKLMSPARCDYYHAMVVYEGEDNNDSALAICNRLLDEKEFGDDKYLEEELCVLASNITLSTDRFLETLEYAKRGIAICHGHESMSYDEATLMGRVGQAEQMLGRMEEAKQTFAQANELLKKDKSFGGLIARISLMMKQTTLYSATQEYDKTIALCHEVLSLVRAFHQDPSFIESRPETMLTSGEATREFADFYESQMYCRIAGAYHNKMKQEGAQGTPAHLDSPKHHLGSLNHYLDSINLYLDKWEQTQSHDTPFNLSNAMPVLYFAGRMEQFDHAKHVVADLYKGDSIVSGYVDYLSLLAQDAASRHDFESSSHYLQRALAISDSIRRQETLRMLSEQMSLNMVQHQQLARQEAENKASRYQLVLVIIVVVVLVLALCTVLVILRRRYKEKEEILLMTQQDLLYSKEEINEFMRQLEESKQERSAKSMQELYERIEQLQKERKLYLNPDFNIAMLAEELQTNRTTISACVNTITGKPFRLWLAEYRLKIFLSKQEEAPDTPIEHLLTQCGYKDQSTFRRQFKAIFGTTPSKYKTDEPDEQDEPDEPDEQS